MQTSVYVYVCGWVLPRLVHN